MMLFYDFTDDTKDAGEIGAGHTVTVLYEVAWADEADDGAAGSRAAKSADDWATLRIRYKDPGASKSKEMTRAIGADCYQSDVGAANMRLEASVAEFGLLLLNSQYRGNSSYEHILSMWEGVAQGDREEITEFLSLVRLADGQIKETW